MVAVLLAGCGTSGATVTVPPTVGRSVASAVDAVCAHGLRVEVEGSVAATNSQQAGHAATLTRVTGTTPPAGAAVSHGSIVAIHYVHPSWEGEVLFASTGGTCLVVPAPPPLTGPERAAVAAVASSAWHAVAVRFPDDNRAAPSACVIRGGGSTAGISVPGTCDTVVDAMPGGTTSIMYIETWPAARFQATPRHAGQEMHWWVFTVAPSGRIVMALSAGDVPPQAAH